MIKPPVTVFYCNDALQIVISTNCPAKMHQLLLQGLNTALKLHINSADKIKANEDGMMALADLQRGLIPSEEKLEKAFG